MTPRSATAATPARPAATRAHRPALDSVGIPDAPRGAWLWAALTYAACTLMLAWPGLAGGFLVNPRSDQYIGGFPLREFGAQVLRQTGDFPTWNPYLMSGVPFVAGMAGDIFYPTAFLRLLMPTDAAMTWGFAIHVFLAGLFTFGFLRACGLGFLPALVGGAAYMMSGNVAGLVSPGHDGKLYVSALLPLTCWLVVRGVRDGRRWAWGALAVAIGLAVLSPHPQLLQYLLLTSGFFALFAAFGEWRGLTLERRVAVRRLAFALGAVVLGGAMGAIQYLPVREYVAWSPRAGGREYEFAVSYSMPPEELINAYLPQFSGILEAYAGRNGIHFHSDYIGVAVLVLAGLAFGATAGTRPARRFLWFWAGTLVIALLWALGGFTPFYRLIYAIVPGTKFFRAPSTILYVVSFSLAVLAALGAERGLRGEARRGYLIGWAVFGVLMAVLASTGALTNMSAAFALEGREYLALENAGALTLGAWRSLAFLALTLGVLVALRRRALGPTLAGWALVALVAVDLWSVLRHYWIFSEPAARIYATDPTIDYVRRQPEPGRVLPIPVGEIAPRDAFITGNALMAHRIRNVLGYHGNELGRYQVLYGADLGVQGQYQRMLTNPNFWRLTNLRYVLAGVPELGEGFQRVAGPTKNAAGSTVSLFRVPGDNPVAWVAPVIFKLPDEAVLGTVLDPRFDLGRAALFDTAAPVSGRPIAAPPAPLSLRAAVGLLEAGRISVRLDAPAPAGSALVVSENYYPGWRATADGKPATVGRANFTLIGVELPEGAREVELVFRSEAYRTGKTVTLIALAVAAALWVWGAASERRARG